MPTVKVRCSGCGQELTLADEELVQQGPCPNCRQVLIPESLQAVVVASDASVTEENSAPLIVAAEPESAVMQEVAPAAPLEQAIQPLPLEQVAAPTADETPPTQFPLEPHALEAEVPLFPTGPSRPFVQHGRGGSWFLALVVIPLISYSILATILVAILYTRLESAERSPLEGLPDLEGELRGASRQKQNSMTYERIAPETRLPARLCVRLGETIRVGDLEATPRRVELRPVVFQYPGAQSERSVHESLVLHLHLRNLSGDVVFAPTDPYFERRWKPGKDSRGARPYTFLEIGTHSLYGGPIRWRSGQFDRREAIEGQQFARLEPGQEQDTIVCTDPDDQVAELLSGEPGPLRWRVQLRRGLVRVRERDVSATAVIGVEFTARDVQREAGPF